MPASKAADQGPARSVWIGMRPMSAMLAALALMLQLITPSLAQSAAANGASWIEICAEAGAVWIAVEDEFDPDSDTKAPRHSECRDCLLCTVATPAAQPVAATLSGPVPVFCVLVTGAGSRMSSSKPFERPMTRGPPRVFQVDMDRARSAGMAQFSQKGDAL